MAGSGSSSTSLADKYMKPMSSFFICPRLFTTFTSKKVLHETENALSPTSILDSKPSSALKNPFWSETSSPTTAVGEHSKRFWDKLDSKGLVDALSDDTQFSTTRTVVFGSQLRIQTQPSQSPKSSFDFGVNVRNSQLGKSAVGSANSALETSSNNNDSPGVFTRCVSLMDMELSEEYTRVISHGPNPRTTHIFNNCIIETSYFNVADASAVKSVLVPDQSQIRYPSESFLSFCFQCSKDIRQGTDIYMYRGERAFCSTECRYKGMLLEGEDIEGI